MGFLAKGYKVPTESRYLKLQQGENNFRVLSSAIIGYEYWNNDNKPVRNKSGWAKRPVDVKTKDDGSYDIKHFWAFVVWNYEESKIQIMEITQKTIMNPIKALVDNVKWGDPKEYDLTITKVGDGFETKYTVMPNPKTEIQKEIQEEFNSTPVDLEMLFESKDPFAIKEISKEEEKEILDEVKKVGV